MAEILCQRISAHSKDWPLERRDRRRERQKYQAQSSKRNK